MFVDDWKKWMDQHHIKLRGDPNDSRQNEGQADVRIRRTGLADESQGNVQQAGNRGIFRDGEKRQT